MTIHVTLTEAEGKLAEILDLASRGEVVSVEVDGRDPLYVSSHFPRRRLGVWSKYGPLSDPDLFLRPDPDLEEADEPVFPPE